MIRRRFRSYGRGARGALAVAALLLSPVGAARASDLVLDVYGLSYHPDRNGVHAAHVDNQFNPGLGLRYERAHDARGIAFVEAGTYLDSGRHWAAFAGPGYQYKLGDWRPGVALVLFNSPTYNHGRPFIAPIPLLGYDFGAVRLNVVYAPRVAHYNDFEVFGFYLSIPLPRF